jgi:hypothetical protein
VINRIQTSSEQNRNEPTKNRWQSIEPRNRKPATRLFARRRHSTATARESRERKRQCCDVGKKELSRSENRGDVIGPPGVLHENRTKTERKRERALGRRDVGKRCRKKFSKPTNRGDVTWPPGVLREKTIETEDEMHSGASGVETRGVASCRLPCPAAVPRSRPETPREEEKRAKKPTARCARGHRPNKDRHGSTRFERKTTAGGEFHREVRKSKRVLGTWLWRRIFGGDNTQP